MRGVGIPSGLAALLSKLGLAGKMGGEKGLVQKGEGKGMTEAEAAKAGLEKGAQLGEGGALLSGLGYNTKDHRTSAKNIAEQANLERFLKEMEPEGPKTAAEAKGTGAEETKGKAEAKDKGEAREAAPREAPAEKKGERAEEGRVQGQAEAKEQVEARETREAPEAEGQQQRQKDESSDDEDKPGAGWVAEELDAEEGLKTRNGLRTRDSLGDPHRCRGALDDGTRCLRKPVKGASYCREHYVPTPPPSV